MVRRFLFDLVIGRRLRRYRRRRRRLTPRRILRWMIGKVVGTIVVFAILSALVVYYFHGSAVDLVLAGDASAFTLVPLVLGRWLELAAAFVVSALSVFIPGGDDHDWD